MMSSSNFNTPSYMSSSTAAAASSPYQTHPLGGGDLAASPSSYGGLGARVHGHHNPPQRVHSAGKSTPASSHQQHNNNSHSTYQQQYSQNGNGSKATANNGNGSVDYSVSVSSAGSSSFENSPPSTSTSTPSSSSSQQPPSSSSQLSESALLVTTIDEAYRHAIQLVKAQGAPSSIVDMETTINVTELAVRRIIYFFKMISDFRQLEHDLMAALLKFSMMKLLQIHGVNSYNKQDNTFKEPNTDDVAFPANSLEGVYGPETYRTVMSITTNLCDLCEGNNVFLKIIMLITLFDPLNSALSADEKTRVEELQSKYISLLYSHLRDYFGSPKAELKYKGFLFEMSKVTELSSWFEKTVAEQANQDSIRPLMKEVFSFNEAGAAPEQPASTQTACEGGPSSRESPEPPKHLATDASSKPHSAISPIPTAPDSPASSKDSHSPAPPATDLQQQQANSASSSASSSPPPSSSSASNNDQQASSLQANKAAAASTSNDSLQANSTE